MFYKRVISLFLAVVLLVSILPPVTAKAQNNVANESDGGVLLEAENSFGTLLVNTVEEENETVSQTSNRIFDLEISESTARVEYNTAVDANLVVAIYTDDGTKLLGSGVVSAPEKEKTATVEIEIPVMPTYFKAAAFLLDPLTNDPLSEEFKTDRYTKVMQDILAATVEDFDPELVLNLDESNTTNFAVFSETTLREDGEGENNQLTDNGDGTYTIVNADESFLSLKAGDTFTYTYPDSMLLIVCVAEVTVEGTTVTVTEDPDADLSDVFDFVKIEADSYDKEITYDESTLDEGFTIVASADPAMAQSPAANALDYSGEASFTQGLELNRKFKTSENTMVTISGSVEWGATVSLELYLSKKYTYVDLSVDYFVDGTIEVSGKFELVELKMCRLSMPLCMAVKATVTPIFEVEATGKLSTIFHVGGNIGSRYDSDVGWQDTSSPPSVGCEAKFTGKLYIGVKGELAVVALSEKIAKLALSESYGGEISVSDTLGEQASSSVIHECDTCFEGDICGIFSAELTASFLNSKWELKWTLLEVKVKLSDIYFSWDFEDWGLSVCPHKLYRTTVTVQKETKELVEGAQLRLREGDEEITSVVVLDSNGKPVSGRIPDTDQNGQSEFYLHNGEYVLFAEFEGEQAVKDVTVLNNTKNLKVTIPSKVPENTLILSKSEATLYLPGEGMTLFAVFNGVDVTKACQWSSSDSSVATVTEDGEIQLVGKGTATITADTTCNGEKYTAQCLVTVIKIEEVASGICGDDLTWSLDSLGNLRIEGTGRMDTFDPYNNPVPWNCDAIRHVYLPKEIRRVDTTTFQKSPNLESFTVDGDYYCSYEGALFDNTMTYFYMLPPAWKGAYSVPTGVRDISGYAFENCVGLTGLMIPDTVREMNPFFSNCSSLEYISVSPGNTYYYSLDGVLFDSDNALLRYPKAKQGSYSVPKGTTQIASSAFYECTGLESIEIPDGVTSIGSQAFWYCSKLKSVPIPESVTYLGGSAFNGTAVREVHITSLLKWCQINFDRMVFPYYSLYLNGELVSDLVIPEGVISIPKRAFDDCKITSAVIPEGVTVINENAFSTDYLTTVSLPNSLKRIEKGAFSYSGIETVYYAGTAEQWAALYIGSGNEDVTGATIHFESTMPESQTEALSQTTGQTEPVETTEIIPEETNPEETAEPSEVVTEPAHETEPVFEAESLSNMQWSILPPGAKLERKASLLSAFSGKETVKNGLRTVSFTGLEPDEEYALIVSLAEGSLKPEDLQYIDQANADKSGNLSFSYIPRTDVTAIVQLFGIPSERKVVLDREYFTVEAGAAPQTITASVIPEKWSEYLSWSADNPEGEQIISVNEFGDVTPLAPGTAYAVATVTCGDYVFSNRCRVDVTEKRANLEVNGVSLTKNAITVELYSREYASVDILPILQQNLPTAAAAVDVQSKPQDNGVAVSRAYFADESAAEWFDLVVKDDRKLLVVPKQKSITATNDVAKKYISNVIVEICGAEYTSQNTLTLTVAKSLPKLKTTTITFNSFYPGQRQAINIPDAKVTSISCENLPDWLRLYAGELSLTEDVPAKGGSAKLILLVETEEWAVPVETSLAVKCSYKAPGLKLSASSIQLAGVNSDGVKLQLLSKDKKLTLSDLGVSGISAPEGYSISNYNAEDGSFVIKATENFQPGKINLKVGFSNTSETVAIPLTVKVTPVTLKLAPNSITLNSGTGDSAAVTVTATPADYRLTAPDIRIVDAANQDKTDSGELKLSYENGRLRISTTDLTPDNAKYTLYISAEGGKEAALKISTTNAAPTLKLKANGNLDLSFPDRKIGLATTFKNHSGGNLKAIDYTVTESSGKTILDEDSKAIQLTKDGADLFVQLKESADINIKNTYTLNLKLTLADGSVLASSVKIPVKQTNISLKLSANKLTLNKAINDKASVTVTCATKDYNFTEPVWQLLDSKGNDASGQLDISWNNGKLTVATTEATPYGGSYKLQIAPEKGAKAVTLAIVIPAEAKSKVTGTLKATGNLDVIRDGTALTITPTWKNCNDAERTEELKIFCGDEEVTNRFVIEEEDGKYILTRGENLDHTQKYTATLTATFANGNTAMASGALKLKMGSAKLTVNADSTTLFANDKHSRVNVSFASADSTLNKVAKVTLDPKLANQFELFDYGNGQYAIGFKDGAVPAKLTSANISLNVWLEGNESAKANASVKVKLSIVR